MHFVASFDNKQVKQVKSHLPQTLEVSATYTIGPQALTNCIYRKLVSY